MKKFAPVFYPLTNNHLLLNEEAFEMVHPLIEYAVVTKHRDVYVLERLCHRMRLEQVAIIRNGQTIPAKKVCSFCLNRLKMVVGHACSAYQPIKKEKYEDFSYLTSVLEEQKVRCDSELRAYVDMFTSSYEDPDNEIREMTYKEYTALFSFLAKFNQAIENLHRVGGFFAKFLR